MFESVYKKDAEWTRRIVFLTGDTVNPDARGFREKTGSRWFVTAANQLYKTRTEFLDQLMQKG